MEFYQKFDMREEAVKIIYPVMADFCMIMLDNKLIDAKVIKNCEFKFMCVLQLNDSIDIEISFDEPYDFYDNFLRTIYSESKLPRIDKKIRFNALLEKHGLEFKC